MDVDTFLWTYGTIGEDGELDHFTHKGPVPLSRIEEILGGPFTFKPLIDGTVLAFRNDAASQTLPHNSTYPGIRGKVVLGKFSGDVFVGVLGVVLRI